jgi:hypothetical protein
MDRRLRAPLDFDVHVVREDAKRGTVVIEWTDERGMVQQAEVPLIALTRHARRLVARA